MKILLNYERTIYAAIEFFAANGLILLIVNKCEFIDQKYFDGWLLWVLLIIYHFVIPFFLNGRTLFMLLFGISIIDENDKNISKSIFIKRYFLKLILILTFIECIKILIFRKKIPFWDEKLKLQMLQILPTK